MRHRCCPPSDPIKRCTFYGQISPHDWRNLAKSVAHRSAHSTNSRKRSRTGYSIFACMAAVPPITVLAHRILPSLIPKLHAMPFPPCCAAKCRRSMRQPFINNSTWTSWVCHADTPWRDTQRKPPLAQRARQKCRIRHSGDDVSAASIAALLDALDRTGELPHTILYTLNAADSIKLFALACCFHEAPDGAWVQFGSAWWFPDNMRGMREQLSILTDIGLLGSFVGMLTDSRSFLSYPRHEYFRRILCELIGGWVDGG